MKNYSIFITNLRFWLIAVIEFSIFGFFFLRPCQSQVVEPLVPVRNPGQMPLPPGLEIPHQRIKNSLGGVYSQNITLFFRNSPFRVMSDLIVEAGATLKIETGVQMYFDTGVGLKVWGTIEAIGNEFAHIQMLPYQQQLNYDDSFPDFRLIDGPNVRQGRLQVRFRDRWRSVCTQVTNWTSIDTGVACRSMGYTDGAFYTWFRRNNDTYPFVMPKPDCLPTAKTLWQCQGFSKPENIPMSENLCQGEDDIGLYCWGQPSFTGWAKHWKGLQIYNSPYHFVHDDPDMVTVMRESDSRLEFIDILYAGYDGQTRNATPALYIEGVPPIINGLRVMKSARDGIYFYEPSGPIIIANSTVSYNRGHGIAVDNTTDGRMFVNMTLIEHNYGDGIWYKQRQGGLNLVKSLGNARGKRQAAYYEEEKPRLEMCQEHELPRNYFFPHLIKLHLKNGTVLDPQMPPMCWMIASLPRRLPYTYTIQFLGVSNLNPPHIGSSTHLIICDGNSSVNTCFLQRHRIPIKDGVFPQSISVKSSGNPIYIGLDHDLGPFSTGRVFGDVDLTFKLHAAVTDKAFYGLNVTHSMIHNNTGNGVQAIQIRDRTALSNVTVESNEGLAGFLVKDGAADIWINDTSLSYNWGDGMNVSYYGGAININGSRFFDNRWRGFAVHYNQSIPFYSLRQEIVIKGRPVNNIFYPPTVFRGNFWGGVLVGNYCLSDTDYFEPRILVNWVQFINNFNHPPLEVFSCQQPQPRNLILDVTGNVFESNSEVAFRMAPAVNVEAVINSNQFLNNNYSALLIRNADHPQLKHLPATVTIAKNIFKKNEGPFIVSIGLNEEAPNQKMVFNQQNEVRENKVINPFPYLKPRSTPYAALVVSSSNVKIRRNCFSNMNADYEIGTELMDHSKIIDAKENNWGFPRPENFMNRIFDQFNRYSLASINVNPFASICNQRTPQITLMQQYFRKFKPTPESTVLGGTIYENSDLDAKKYTIVEDLHVEPGAKLTIAPGAVLEFENGIGMLVQGELLRADFTGSHDPVVFTSKPFEIPTNDKIRLVDENGNEGVAAGRLELYVEGQWGTVCNRSWTANLAQLACNQLGLIMDPQYFENWRIFVDKGDLPMIADNIRCEEREYDITQCRMDGVFHNVQAGCRSTEVVGLRCSRPYWSGVRYSLLANPPTVTGQMTMNNWMIENAGLYDYRTSTFSPALQIDWNYHSFYNITVKNNYYDGIDIVYNDLTRKPALRNTLITQNRRNGLKLRSVGITIEQVLIENNENAGVRFNPRISETLQRDIVGWLDKKEQPELEANNVFLIPNHTITELTVLESQLNQRKFLVAKPTPDCPLAPFEPCSYTLELYAGGDEYGLSSKMAVQIVNRAHNESDEDAVFYDQQAGKQWSVRNNVVQFPIVSAGNRLTLKYTRSYGSPKMILLILFLDAQEYLDRFVHVYESVIQKNQYGVSAVHYSNLTFDDGTVLNRHTNEKIWFQKVNFTENTDAVVWIHSPQHDVLPNTPIAEITWHIDNCSMHDNTGPIIDTHRDLFASANIFHWKFWSNTFANNTNSGISIQLPDTYNLLWKKRHTFWMTENRFEFNEKFEIELGGYYCFANISSNNFTDNYAKWDSGIMKLKGMEKELIMERNRFFNNWGHWMVKVDITSQSLKNEGYEIPAFIQNNYFQMNHFIKDSGEYVDSWPRSFAVGVFGIQKMDIHFNRLNNALMDFEVVAGCKPQIPGTDFMNITHNWWGPNSDGAIPQRIFDMDDRNSYTIGQYSPYFSSKERFIDFWWDWHYAQLSHAVHVEPAEHDLHGRMYESKNLTLDAERWYPFPYYYRPFRPYRITRDLTIMPGATLTIQKNVEVHIWPNVRILVLGNLVADATLWQPVRFLPINSTEALEQKGKVPSRYKRSILLPLKRILKRSRERVHSHEYKHMKFLRKKRRAGYDPVFIQFPVLRRDDPYFQSFNVLLSDNTTIPGKAGFLEIYNATSGEIIPSCDRQFTRRNAQVVCRELGFETQNVYHWLTPRWDYNPKIRLIKTYMEPRECIGTEEKLDKCNLRLTGNDSMWMCMDNEHFNYIHCGQNTSLENYYIGNWGGITFGQSSLELNRGGGQDSSILRHVEIVGGGQVHNDSFQSAALQIIRRNPIVENLNITNSSMHGLQVISPRDSIVFTRLNITDNKGQGMSILTTNLKASSVSSPTPKGPLNLPYNTVGLLDICSSGKKLEISDRIILYYKYDSFPVDCVKIFDSKTRKLGFRFLQVNLYGATNGLGRSDMVSIYRDSSFSQGSLFRRFNSESDFDHNVIDIQGTTIAIHLRATAADGEYGFIAEISTLPTTPDSRNVNEVALRNSRFINNDRGALEYRNTGEVGPNVMIEQCAIENNGYFLYGNISTSAQAMELHLHNTLLLLYRANAVRGNRGGLLVTAQSSSAVAQLNAVIKNCAFTMNSNSTTLAFLGNNYQRISLLNNIISKNYALYFDTIFVQRMSANFTKNLITNNTGLNTVDTQGHSRIAPDSQVFLNNFFEHNLALGHQLQYQEAFGYQPDDVINEFDLRPRKKRSILGNSRNGRRLKRQVLSQKGVSFDWWTHPGIETERYRSTILAGSSNQRFERNVFNNPLNPFELTTSFQTQFDTGAIDAKDNYWGYPGTIGVAAGKIRDQQDFPYLIKVNYIPVLDSNTSLIDGDCPAGWFQAGVEEFKSCFLFVGASMTYENAIKFCEELDAFMPILRNDDPRQKEIARKIDIFGQLYVSEIEKYSSFGMTFDIPIWVSTVTLPSNQCGYMSSRSGSIGEQNCNNLLPFVCEKGTKPYQEPVLWRKDIILAVVIACVLVLILALLLIGWCAKSKRRDEDHFIKKQYIRESLHRKKDKTFSNQITMGNGNLFINEGIKGRSKINGNHEQGLTGPGKKKSNSRSNSSTATTSSCDQTYSSPSRTCTDSLCTDNYSETTYTGSVSTKNLENSIIPTRSVVSTTPNPYSEISTLRQPSKNVKSALGPRRDTDLSTSSCTSCSGIYSLRTCTCSQCPSDTTTERESTITEESSNWDNSSSSTRSSDSTITERPLLGRQVLSGIERNNTKSSMNTLRASSRPDLSTNRSLVDYFRGGGREVLTPSKSNPSIYQGNKNLYKVENSKILNNTVMEEYDREPGRPRRPSWHSNQKQNFQYGDVPVYNPDLKLAFSHSPVSGRSQGSIPSFTSPGRMTGHPQPSRSLMDLNEGPRRKKSGSTAMETSM